MKYESIESESPEIKLGGFQNEIFTDDPMNADLMPKLCFTTDAAEAEEAANADRGDPQKAPDIVFYVEPMEEADEGGKRFADLPSFQNEVFDAQATNLEEAPASEYYGPSSASLDLKIDSATRSLTAAREQLEWAIKNGTGVITAMTRVESAQKLLDTYTQMYNKALEAESAQSASLISAKSDDAGEIKLGSVSHAQWKLEQAYKNNNSIAIENAKRELAHEKAKEEAKK